MKLSSIAIFGGSFDPVHIGHLWIATAALEQLPVSQIRWIPASTSPLKPTGPIAGDADRLAMLRLALGGRAEHVVDTREIDRGGVSYTVNTVAEIAAEQVGFDIYLIIGADSLASLDRWQRPAELLNICRLAVVHRGGDPPPDYAVLQNYVDEDRIARIRGDQIDMPVIEISSGEIRSRIAAGRSIWNRVPAGAGALIEAQSLYRSVI